MKEGRNRYENVVRQVCEGERPLYRPASWEKEARAMKKKMKGRSWWGERNESVMFVQATPNEVLRKEVQKIIDASGFKVKVVQRGGIPLKSMLQRSDVDPQMKCLDDDCPVCLTAPKGCCQMESVGYKIWCIECKQLGHNAVMDGETGRTARMRCKEHLSALDSKTRSSNLREHCFAFHGGRRVEFACEVVSRFPGDPLTRQLEEAIRIDHQEGISLNDQSEFVRPAGVRISVARM